MVRTAGCGACALQSQTERGLLCSVQYAKYHRMLNGLNTAQGIFAFCGNEANNVAATQ